MTHNSNSRRSGFLSPILLTGFPEMDVAAQAILRQADEILLKDTDFKKLVELIKHRIAGETLNPSARLRVWQRFLSGRLRVVSKIGFWKFSLIVG
jgi:DNA-binding NarL/FixJ family response regulator